jgi:hypothetical protein
MDQTEIDVSIETIAPVSEDARGWIRQLKFPDGIKQVTVCFRFAGATACHVHTKNDPSGADPSKNPEIIFLALGQIKLTIQKLDGSVEKTTCDQGTFIRIPAGCKHRTVAITDIMFLECRVTEFDPAHPNTTPCEIEG